MNEHEPRRRAEDDMNQFRIENSDRGITLNKSLAWSVLSVIVAVLSAFATLIWNGSETITQMRATDTAQTEMIGAIQAKMDKGEVATDVKLTSLLSRFSDNEIRFRNLEQFSARTDAQYTSLSEILKELKAGQVRTETLILQLVKDGTNK